MSERRTILNVHLKASKSKVYNTLLDKELIHKWKVPDEMKCIVHQYNAVENGTFRISLVYGNVNEMGKTFQNIDKYHGYFQKLVSNELIIEIDEFESDNDEMQGIMTITYRLSESDGGTNLTIIHDNLPIGISLSDNEIGWKMALDSLVKLIEN